MRAAIETQDPEAVGYNTKIKREVWVRGATPKDAEDIARIHVKSWQESYRGILHAEYLANINIDERILLRKKQFETCPPALKTFVALVQDRVIGFCDAGCASPDDAPIRGKIQALYLLEDYKGQGIGTRLWMAATTYLKENNLLPYMNWVLEDNHRARSFYEAKGGKLFLKREIEFGGRIYQKVAYRYDD